MKINAFKSGIVAAACGATLLLATVSYAQTAVTTTTSTGGTITQFSPDTLIIKTETSSSPVTYSYTKTTTYVDENGAPVSMDVVKSGLPVTVYYEKDGDRMVALERSVVKKVVTEAAPENVVEKKTTTTTTTTDH